jgi:iron complex outermembrane receptor protein
MEIMNLISANNSGGNVTLGNVIGSTTFRIDRFVAWRAAARRWCWSTAGASERSRAASRAEGVNLAAIPFAAIERVEVLKDGASAVYGSDAISGVINFIMRTDFSGIDATVYAGTPTRSSSGENGNQYQVMGTLGTGDLVKDKYNAFICSTTLRTTTVSSGTELFENQLPAANQSRYHVGTDISGLYRRAATRPVPSATPASDCAPSIVIGSRCRFDPAAYPGVQSLPDTKQLNLFGSANYMINNNWTAFLTGLYSKQETRFIIQPVPLSDQIFTTATATGAADVILPPTSPFYPHQLAIDHEVDGQPLNVRYRAVENGNRDTTDVNQAWQIVAGVTGTAWNWDWEGTFNYSENTSREQLNGGFPLYSRILPLLNSGVVNLFGPNSADITQQILATNFNGETFHAKLSGYGVNLKGAGRSTSCPRAGADGGGFPGGEEKLSQNPNPLLQTGDVAGYGGNLRSSITRARYGRSSPK